MAGKLSKKQMKKSITWKDKDKESAREREGGRERERNREREGVSQGHSHRLKWSVRVINTVMLR